MNNNYLIHRDTKYIDKKMGKNGKWQYTYARPAGRDKRVASGTATVAKGKAINSMRPAGSGSKTPKPYVSPEFQQELAYNNQENVYYGKPASSMKPAKPQTQIKPKEEAKPMKKVTTKIKEIASETIDLGKKWVQKMLAKVGG